MDIYLISYFVGFIGIMSVSYTHLRKNNYSKGIAGVVCNYFKVICSGNPVFENLLKESKGLETLNDARSSYTYVYMFTIVLQMYDIILNLI